MKRVLLDTNIILDVLLNRHPFVTDSARIWKACDDGLLHGHVSAFSLPTIYYICSKHDSRTAASNAIDRCLAAFDVSALYRECVVAARHMSGPDFEDNLQTACAVTDFLQAIITRDKSGFVDSPIPVFTPVEMISQLVSQSI